MTTPSRQSQKGQTGTSTTRSTVTTLTPAVAPQVQRCGPRHICSGPHALLLAIQNKDGNIQSREMSTSCVICSGTSGWGT